MDQTSVVEQQSRVGQFTGIYQLTLFPFKENYPAQLKIFITICEKIVRRLIEHTGSDSIACIECPTNMSVGLVETIIRRGKRGHTHT